MREACPLQAQQVQDGPSDGIPTDDRGLIKEVDVEKPSLS
jgi:hypothetical protein